MSPHICPPHHRHGENLNCYTAHGCRCGDCRRANTEHGFWARHMRAAGRFEAFNSLVPATGTRRRVQALMTLGYSQSAIARRLGIHQNTCSEWMQCGYVRASTHATIAALYDQLQDTPAPRSTKGERMSAARTVALAERRGYARPIDWDDIDNDPAPSINPTSEDELVDEIAVALFLDGHRVQLTPRERQLVVDQLTAQGLSAREIAIRLGVTSRTVTRDRHPAEQDTEGRAAA